MREKNCKQCGKPFNKPPKESYLQFSKRVHCSEKCQAKASLGRRLPQEAIERMRQTKLAQKVRLTQEQKKHISKKLTGRKQSPTHIKNAITARFADYVYKTKEEKHEYRYFYQIKLLFNLSKEEYLLRVSQQNNTCAICLLPSPKTRLSVDHDHKTGKVRGLLCRRCNQGLGMFKDDALLLMGALDYLKKHANT